MAFCELLISRAILAVVMISVQTIDTCYIVSRQASSIIHGTTCNLIRPVSRIPTQLMTGVNLQCLKTRLAAFIALRPSGTALALVVSSQTARP